VMGMDSSTRMSYFQNLIQHEKLEYGSKNQLSYLQFAINCCESRRGVARNLFKYNLRRIVAHHREMVLTVLSFFNGECYSVNNNPCYRKNRILVWCSLYNKNPWP